MRNGVILLIGCGMLCACSAPVGPIPGGKLEGQAQPWPDDWTFSDQCDNVLLETRPADPYSVTIWGARTNGQFYVAAGSADSEWVKNIRSDDQVVLSIDGNLFTAQATEVADNSELNAVMSAYISKYDIDPADNFIEEGGVVFRLNEAQ